MTTTGKSSTDYSFGNISVRVEVDGNIDRPQQIIDHMLSTANTVIGVEVVNHGISESIRSDDKTEQKCDARVNFGGITVNAEIVFKLTRKVAKRKLNGIVFGAVLPKVWRVAELYLGDNQDTTNPPSPAIPRSRQDVLNSLDNPLSLQQGNGQPQHQNGLGTRQREMATH